MKKILISLLFAVICTNAANAADIYSDKDNSAKSSDKKSTDKKTKVELPKLSPEQQKMLDDERKKRSDRRAEKRKKITTNH